MRLTGHTLATPEYALEAALGLFRDLGLSAVEIVQDDDYPCGISVAPTSAELRAVARALNRHHLRASHVTPYVRTLDDPDPGRRGSAVNAMRRSLDAAAALGADGVRVLAGRRDLPDAASRYGWFLESLALLAPEARSLDVSLNIETKGWSFACGSERTQALLDAIGDRSVGVLIDPANLLADGEDPVASTRRLAPSIRHLHLTDSRPGPDHVWLPAPLGSGATPWASILGELRAAGYDGDASLEYERRWHPERLEHAAAGLPREIAAARRWVGP